MGLQMMEDVREIVLNSIRLANPGISQQDLIIEFIYRYYGKELSAEYLADVARSIKGAK